MLMNVFTQYGSALNYNSGNVTSFIEKYLIVNPISASFMSLPFSLYILTIIYTCNKYILSARVCSKHL
jgi:hypothetical protein